MYNNNNGSNNANNDQHTDDSTNNVNRKFIITDKPQNDAIQKIMSRLT